MEVKIFCACGSKYKFDVEPLNGKLPGPVACPACGADGTEKGNEIVAQNLQAAAAAAPVAQPAAVRVGSAVAPAPAAAASAAAPQSTNQGGFVAPSVPRSSKQAAAVRVGAHAAVAAPAPVIPGPPNPATARTLSVAAVHAPGAQPDTPPLGIPVPSAPPRTIPEEGPSFVRGVVGIALASIVGLIGWFAVTSVFSRRLGWLAIGVGALIGWTAHWLGRERSMRLGIAASIATILVMLVGTIWSARHEAMVEADLFLAEMYDEQVAYAKEAVKAKTDDDIRKLIQGAPSFSFEEEEDPEFEQISFQEVTDQEIADWKRTELPELRKFAAGKVTRTQFERDKRPAIETMFSAAFVIGRAFRISMLIWIGAGVAAAWKLAAPKS